MSDPRILTIQDISCVGQCSLTVALPILSACGVETAILPSAVLSTHTAGFTGYTFRDLTEGQIEDVILVYDLPFLRAEQVFILLVKFREIEFLDHPPHPLSLPKVKV